MRKLVFLGFVFLGVLLAACTGTKPQVNLETVEFDFGDVVNGEIVSRDVTVTNTGEADLFVDSVSTTCGCTTASLEPMTVPAGGSASLHIEFDSGAHGPELTGQVMREIYLASNDPKTPEAKVSFVANVVSPDSKGD